MALDPAQLAPLAVVAPLLVAALIVAIRQLLPRVVIDALTLLTALCTTGLLGWLTWESTGPGVMVAWLGLWTPAHGMAVGIGLAVDPLAGGMATLVGGLVCASIVYAWYFFDSPESLFHVLLLCFLGAMVGFVLSIDLFNMFVCFELMGAAAYALTALKIEEEQALEGGLNFAVVNTVGAILILMGVGLLYGRTGALNMAQIAAALERGGADALVYVAFSLIAWGLLCKAAIVPFHFWLADAHAVAPTPVCVLFSGVMVELGLFGLARIIHLVFAGVLGPHLDLVRGVLVVLGCSSALVGAVMCLGQRHLKRLLAFSTISHSGLILLAIALLSPRALAAAALYVAGHGAAKGALFMIAGVLLHRFGTVDENELRGRGKELPAAGIIFTLGGLALAGLPIFATSAAEGLLHEPLRELGYGWLVWVIGGAAALTGGAVLRAAGHIFLGWGPPQNLEADTPEHEEKETRGAEHTTPWLMLGPPAALVAAAVVLAFVPALTRGVLRGADTMTNHDAYVMRVLSVAAEPVPAGPAEAQLPGSAVSVVSGVATTLAALAIALFSLLGYRLPGRWAELISAGLQGSLRPLRQLHSGKVGDYCLWLLVGLVAMAGTLLLAGR